MIEETKRPQAARQAKPAVELDDTKETVSQFLDKVAVAKAEGLESIEASPEIIAHYNRTGLNGAKYFCFGGLKVYPRGQTEEIEAEANKEIGKILHGEKEGTLL